MRNRQRLQGVPNHKWHDPAKDEQSNEYDRHQKHLHRHALESAAIRARVTPFARRRQVDGICFDRRGQSQHRLFSRYNASPIGIDQSPKLILRRQRTRRNSHEANSRVRKRLVLPRVSALTNRDFMTTIIELDDSDDAQIEATQHKIRHQLLVASPDGVAFGVISIDINQLRQRDLHEEFVFGIQTEQLLIERPLTVGQKIAGRQRPRSIRERLTEKRLGRGSLTQDSPQGLPMTHQAQGRRSPATNNPNLPGFTALFGDRTRVLTP